MLAGVIASALACALACALGASEASAHLIEGRVIHPSDPNAPAGIEVSLFGLRAKGPTVRRSVQTDAQGRFRFENVEEGRYFVTASYQELTFPGGSANFDLTEESRTESLVFHVYDRASDPGAIEIAGVRWIVEREAGQYRVSNMVTVRNPTKRAIVVTEEAPTPLRIPLARGHGELETPFGQPPAGLITVGDAVELRGPFFPGDREYLFAYALPTPGAALESGFVLAEDSSEVAYAELMVRDFGVLVEVDRLHPARPVRQGDEVYMRWIGFTLEAGTRIPFRLEPLPPRGRGSRAGRAALVALLAAGSLFFVLQPVRNAATRGGQAPDGASEEAMESPARSERHAVIASLVDLEHDFETGKVSREDHDRLRGDLRREAMGLLERERTQAAPPIAAPEGTATAPPVSCECGRSPLPGDRYCAACGKEL